MQKLNKYKKYSRIVFLLIVQILGILAGVEFGFRLYLLICQKEPITILSKQEILDKAWFEPHPHLVYVFKPNNAFVSTAFKRAAFTTNQFGFRSTLEFDVQTVSKPADTLRIAALGGSTTMGVNDDHEIWPYLIGKYLYDDGYRRNVEILNEGIMGYTSLDNLLDLSMRIIDFKCDVYIIYLGINDLLPMAPADIYRTDYAHFRKTLYENLNFSSFFPSWLLKSAAIKTILHAAGIPDSRNLIDNTVTGQFRKGFYVPKEEKPIVLKKIRQTVVRNVLSMVGIIRSHTPDATILLSSFFDLHNRKIISKLNQDFCTLSDTHHLVFVDAAGAIPRNQDMVYDYGHFTPEGDRRMGALFAAAVLSSLSENQRG